MAQMHTVEQGQRIHCNRCDQGFEAPKELERFGFCGDRAARITTFCECPRCHQFDSHWLFVSDIDVPEFEGNFDQRDRAYRAWLREH